MFVGSMIGCRELISSNYRMGCMFLVMGRFELTYILVHRYLICMYYLADDESKLGMKHLRIVSIGYLVISLVGMVGIGNLVKRFDLCKLG